MAESARAELSERLLPFWLAQEDSVYGGYFEAVDAQGRIYPNAPKTVVFLSRMLWTMSEAARRFGFGDCASQARRTYLFLDRLHDQSSRGGYFASATRDGAPYQRHKHIYAQAFVIFGLAGYASATGDEAARAKALDLFRTVEDRAHDHETGLYREAFDESWQEIPNEDRALGETIAPYTADTHLHLIEAYTQLLRTAPQEEVRKALHALVETFLARFIAADGSFAHQKLDRNLMPVPGTIWPGHDIEASWLLTSASDLLGDRELEFRVHGTARRLALGAVKHGAGPNGGWAERVSNGKRHPWCLWWVQAEAVIGTLNEGLRSRDLQLIEQAVATWSFIERCMIDRSSGDWRLRVTAEGVPDETCPRVIFWKDAYHQARACMELVDRCSGALPPVPA
jgi:mannobiose 2-epimerase